MNDDKGPPGKLRTVITYLEMRKDPGPITVPAPALKLALMRAERPTVSFYRYLYDAVGGPWLWTERTRMTDDALRAIIEHPDVEIYAVYVGGVPAGFSELDCRRKRQVEVAYFGLVPEFTGQGLGRYLLAWTVEAAWRHKPTRVWAHTNTFEHPKALAMYQRAGFVPYDQRSELIDDPNVSAVPA